MLFAISLDDRLLWEDSDAPKEHLGDNFGGVSFLCSLPQKLVKRAHSVHSYS